MPHRRWLALVFAILASCAGVLSNVAAQTTPPAPVTTQFILSGNGTFGVSIKMPANYYTCQLSADATFSATLQLYIARSTSYVAAGTGTLTGGPSLIQYQPQYMTQFEVSVTSYASGSAFVTATCVQTFANISYLTAPINITSLPPVSIGVPTVIPSCPAANYPCGLPTPIPTGTPMTSVSANIGTPTVIPSCPASAYPCGLPTPNASGTSPPYPWQVECLGASYPCGFPTPNASGTTPPYPWQVECLGTSYPCGFPTPIPTGTPYPAPTTSPNATWSPFPGALSELAGPSTAPAASAGQYLACVNSSGQVCTHDTTPVQPSPIYTQPVTSPAPCSTANCQIVAWTTGLPNPLPVTTASASPAATASPGTPPPAQAPWNFTIPHCIYTGNQSLSNTNPVVSAGNAIACQAGSNGSLFAENPGNVATVSISANGTYLANTFVTGGSSVCVVRTVSGASGPTATVALTDQIQAATLGSVNAPANGTANMVVPLVQLNNGFGGVWAVEVIVTNFVAGTGNLTIRLFCNHSGFPFPYAQSSASPQPQQTTIPTNAYNYWLSGSTWNATTTSSPLPVQVRGGGTANNSSATNTTFEACDKSVVVNISSATTTQLVAISGSTTVHVCAFSLYVVSGTLPSFQFETSTVASCASSVTTLTGTYGGIAGVIGEHITMGGGLGQIFQGVSAGAICLVSGGTTPNIQGVLTYDQR